MEAVFKASPVPQLVLLPDTPHFTVYAANKAFTKVTGIEEQDLLNKGIFEVFTSASIEGVSGLKSCLEDVVASNAPVKGGLLQYIISSCGPEEFERKYVVPESTPVLNEHGELEYIIHTLIDVTTQTLSEEEEKKTRLRLSYEQEKYRSLFEHHPDAVVSFDMDGNFVSANESTARIVECSIEELLKISFMPLIAPEDLERVSDHFKKASTGELQRFNSRIITAKGKSVILTITVSPIIVNSEIVGVYGIGKDITKEIQVEQALKLRDKQFQKIMDYSLDLICTIDLNRNFVKVNRASEAILGYRPNELEGRYYPDFVFKESKEKTNPLSGRLREGSSSKFFENQVKRKDGRIIWMGWSVYWDQAEKISYCIGRDITESKRTTEIVKRNERRFRALMQNSEEGIVLIDEDGNVIERSYSAIRILGLESDATKKINYQIIHPQDIEKIDQALNEAFSSKSTKASEFRILEKDGAVRWVEVSYLNRIHDPAVNAVIANIRDITDRKNALEVSRNSEIRFRSLLENSAEGIVLFTPDHSIIEISDSGRRILQYPKVSNLEKIPLQFIHPEDLPQINNTIDEVIKDPFSVKSLQFRFLSTEENYLWIEADFHNQLREPAIEAIVMNFRDISEKKAAIARLKSSEERYKKLFHESPLPMWIYDPDTYGFIEVNQAAIKKYGYSMEEFLNMNITDIRPQEEIPRFAAYMAGEPGYSTRYPGYWQHLKKNGDLLQVDITSQVISHEGRKATLILANDVTEKVIAEQNLKISEEIRRLIMDSALDAIICMDTKGAVTLWNKQAENLFGWTEQEMIGKDLVGKVIPEASRKRYKEALKKHYKAKGPGVTPLTEITTVNRNGREFPIEFTLVQIREEGNEFLCAFVRDITERKKSIAAIQEQNAKLREIAWKQCHIVRAPLSRMIALIDLIRNHTTRGELLELLDFLLLSSEELDDVIKDIVENSDEIKVNS